MHPAQALHSAMSAHADRFAAFGPPVFGFTLQPALRERGWSWFTRAGNALEAQAHYWLADAHGDFRFHESAAGPVGTELRGFVFTDVPGSTGRAGDPVREALSLHLGHVINDHRKTHYEFGAGRRQERQSQRLQEIRALPGESSSLEIGRLDENDLDHAYQTCAALRLRYAEFSAVAATSDGRVVTVVLHDDDAPRLDARLIRVV